MQDDAPDGLFSKLSWIFCNKVHRRTIGSPASEGKVFLRCYNDIPLYDLDMLMPGSTPNPKFIHALMVLVPFFAGFGAGIYKIVDVRLSVSCASRRVDRSACRVAEPSGRSCVRFALRACRAVLPACAEYTVTLVDFPAAALGWAAVPEGRQLCRSSGRWTA